MSEVLMCKNCNSTWKGDRVPDFKCPECRKDLIPIQVSLEVWQSYNREQKESIKEGFLQNIEKSVSNLNPYYIMESHLSNINKNTRTIKNIMVFFTVLWGISVFIGILSFGIFAKLLADILR